MRRFRFAVHLDIKSYFPSVDLEILRRLLAERIRDERFLRGNRPKRVDFKRSMSSTAGVVLF